MALAHVESPTISEFPAFGSWEMEWDLPQFIQLNGDFLVYASLQIIHIFQKSGNGYRLFGKTCLPDRLYIVIKWTHYASRPVTPLRFGWLGFWMPICL
jgi:hypothetical protein